MVDHDMGMESSGLSASQMRRILETTDRYRRYQVLRKLGQGGMASVFEIYHPRLSEKRVLKVLRPDWARSDSPEASEVRSRFHREARLLSRFQHPNLVRIYDLSILPQDLAVIEMEFIEGESLSQKLSRHPQGLEWDEARGILVQTLQGLEHLHACGCVHCDLSPDNLMIEQDGGRVRIIDLGVATLIDQPGDQESRRYGKAAYSAPELWSNRIDSRSDLYSLGVVAYEMLTGRLPFEGHRSLPPTPFEETDPEGKVPTSLRQTLLQMLSPCPDQRPAQAIQVLQTLDDLESLPAPSPRATGPQPSPSEESLGQIQQRLNREFPSETSPVVHSRPKDLGDARQVLRKRRLRRFARAIHQAVSRGRFATARRLIERAQPLARSEKPRCREQKTRCNAKI